MTSTLIHPPKTMLEVWETLPEGTLCQLINNKLIMSPAPKDVHQVILNEINIEISLYLRSSKNGQLRISPYDVYFSNENILQPDLLFIKNENLHKITSPMVGTFYSSSSPDTPPYVSVGDRVSKDSIVCIVEAMKLFNEIDADVEGEMVEIRVNNGQLVEYGQPLFLVKA